jgi:hypothetical protein
VPDRLSGNELALEDVIEPKVLRVSIWKDYQCMPNAKATMPCKLTQRIALDKFRLALAFVDWLLHILL